MTKICTRCKHELSLDRFSIKKGRPGQSVCYRSRCKDCINELSRTKYHPRRKAGLCNHISTVVITDPSNTKKLCLLCGQLKLLVEFHPCCKSPNKLWHWQSYCKVCDAEKHRQKVADGYVRPEPDLALRLLESKLKSVCGNIFQGKYQNHGVDFSLTVEFLRELIKKQTTDVLRCSATKVPLCNDQNKPLSPSIDRINPKLGYTPDNVRIVALAYNLMRRSWSDSDMIDVIKLMSTILA